MQWRVLAVPLLAILLIALASNADEESLPATGRPMERPRDLPASPELLRLQSAEPSAQVQVGPFVSVQVNVNSSGDNVVGDAANEPSIAVSPVDPNQIVIGWRHFDSVSSDFREAGYAFSGDAGATWTFPGVLQDGVFRSDPVLGFDADGNFYYSSLTADMNQTNLRVAVFKSVNGGVSWLPPVDAFGGDKQWMAIDRTGGVGDGNIYQSWVAGFSCCPPNDFNRSIDAGASFQAPLAIPPPKFKWGTLDVGPDGTLYLAGTTEDLSSHVVARSANAENTGQAPVFDLVQEVELGGSTGFGGNLNPIGLLGQVWIATDHSGGSTDGNVYVLSSVDPPGSDPLDVHFIRSTDDGATWSTPIRVNDDPTGARQWFGTMSVAPNGRIDAIWNDTRNDPGNFLSQVFYASSFDGGQTWSKNIAISPPFNPSLGYPRNNKLGDYYHMISDDDGANLAYAATFNGEQDVYFLRIPVLRPVDVDIIPGNDLNPINPLSRGVIAVAILGSDSFDVSDVDATTLVFGPGSAPLAHDNCPHVHDVDHDGLDDLLAHFRIEDSGIAFGDAEACVSGALLDGIPFLGCDDIRTNPACGLGFELALLLPPLMRLRRRRLRSA